MGILQDIGHSLSNAGKAVTHAVNTVGKGIENTLGISGKTGKEIAQIAVGGAAALTGAGFIGSTSLGSTILGSITSALSGGASLLTDLYGSVKGSVNSITSDLQALNSFVIQPVVGPILAIIKAQQSLTTALQTDLHGGIQGLLRLPTDVTNALSGVNAAFDRSVQQLNEGNLNIATKHLVPGMLQSGKEPIDALHETIAKGQALYLNDLGLLDHVDLNQPLDVAAWEAKQKGILDALMTGKTWYDKLMQGFIGLYSVLPFIELLNEPMISDARQLARKAAPVELVGIGEAIEAMYRGVIDETEASDELARHGLDKSRFNLLREIASWLPPEQVIVQWLARGIIDQTAAVRLLGQHRMNVEEAQQYLKAELEIVGPSSAANISSRFSAMAKGFLSESLGSTPPPDVEAMFAQNYLSTEASRYEWAAHWRIPEAKWWINAFWRGIRTREEVYMAFEAMNIPKEIWDDIIQAEYKLWELWLVPDIIASGVGDDAYWLGELTKMGFDLTTSEAVIKYGKTKMKATKSATAADLQKVSLSNAALLYDDGTITREEYASILEAHGYGPESTQLTIDVTDIKNAQAQRKAYATELVDDVKLGLATIDQAVSALNKAGFTTAEVAKYQLAMGHAKKQAVKIPTKAEFDKMAKDTVITQAQWEQGMLDLGYDPQWIPYLWQII